jgi:uncharacterized protein
MNLRAALLVGQFFVGAGLMVFAGCSIIPEAQPDPTRFFVLSTAVAGVAPPANAPVVQLRDVELASYLRARPLIVRRGNNEIEFREFARWGEPLELGIARVLREELMARGTASVRPAAVRGDAPADDYVLRVRVLAAEGNTNGSVEFRAVWDLSKAGPEGSTVAHGEFRPGDLRWDVKSEASLAAQLSQGVAGLAAEVAAAVVKK